MGVYHCTANLIVLNQISDSIDLMHIKCLILAGHLYVSRINSLNPVVLKKAEIVCNFGLSECNKVKESNNGKIMLLPLHFMDEGFRHMVVKSAIVNSSIAYAIWASQIRHFLHVCGYVGACNVCILRQI